MDKEEKNKGGRPKKDVDQSMFENLCSIMCTKDEICGFFDINEKTLTRWCKDTYDMSFKEIQEKKSAKGKMSLRRIQFKLAEKNASMAIFLGKQYLGQKDRIEQEIGYTPEVKISVVDNSELESALYEKEEDE